MREQICRNSELPGIKQGLNVSGAYIIETDYWRTSNFLSRPTVSRAEQLLVSNTIPTH